MIRTRREGQELVFSHFSLAVGMHLCAYCSRQPGGTMPGCLFAPSDSTSLFLEHISACPNALGEWGGPSRTTCRAAYWAPLGRVFDVHCHKKGGGVCNRQPPATFHTHSNHLGQSGGWEGCTDPVRVSMMHTLTNCAPMPSAWGGRIEVLVATAGGVSINLPHPASHGGARLGCLGSGRVRVPQASHRTHARTTVLWAQQPGQVQR